MTTARLVGVALTLLLQGLAGRPVGAIEVWWPPIEGVVGDVEAGPGGRAPLFLLVRDPHPGCEDEDGDDCEDDEDDARVWSVHRWTPERPTALDRILTLAPTKDRPQLQRSRGLEGIVLAVDGAVWVLSPEDLARGETSGLGEPDFEDPSPELRVVRVDSRTPTVVAAGIGNAELFDLRTGESLHLTRLPTDVRRSRTGLRLRSPAVHEIGDGKLYASGPQSIENLRLRTVLLDPAASAEEDDDGPAEAWSLLPGPERVEESWFEWLDGRPFLYCVTLRADKQGIFERKKLRIFELRADRTRSGRRPTFEALSSARMWQDLDVHTVDVDGDDVRDLVLLAPEGFSGNKLILHVYPGRGDGRFESRHLRTVIPELREEWPHLYGLDPTLDGRPDLLIVRDGVLEVYAGAEQPKKKAVIGRTPERRIPLARPGSFVHRLESHGPWLVGWNLGDEGAVVIVDAGL